MTATRCGIDNSMPSSFYSAARYHAEQVLEPIRTYFGIPFSPTSWYRCLTLNRLLRSKDTSDHVKGLATDLELPGIANDTLFWWCADNLQFDQLIMEYPPHGWVHIASAQAGERPRMQRFAIPPDPAYSNRG